MGENFCIVCGVLENETDHLHQDWLGLYYCDSCRKKVDAKYEYLSRLVRLRAIVEIFEDLRI